MASSVPCVVTDGISVSVFRRSETCLSVTVLPSARKSTASESSAVKSITASLAGSMQEALGGNGSVGDTHDAHGDVCTALGTAEPATAAQCPGGVGGICVPGCPLSSAIDISTSALIGLRRWGKDARLGGAGEAASTLRKALPPSAVLLARSQSRNASCITSLSSLQKQVVTGLLMDDVSCTTVPPMLRCSLLGKGSCKAERVDRRESAANSSHVTVCRSDSRLSLSDGS